ncbi:hypothetical protein KZX46_10465 [Polymorphobacter sp. PAMC 29334]|uniref:hypothetical protein n=1 Tax=Polymorphobacter sp. PAMC 29334 TaxID=2862331 RepID=UPI001C78104A|nr:hypothetical protein [Polymorphobacter sp. PAMC 29334]QYE36306.1 hypothetical protein KZX46_10465 [Polymorphobacter sp. PAMC 29334]
MFKIGYLEIEAIVAGMCGVTEGGTIRRRFKYLQRMGFPPRSNTGRGRRAIFNLEQVLQVVMAIELMQVGAGPTRAIRVLRTNWDELRPALALGWLVARTPTLAALRDLLMMNAGSFEDVGRAEDPYEPVLQPFRPVPAIDVLVGLTGGATTTRVILDPAELAVHLILHSGRSDAGYSADDLDEAFADLWASCREVAPDDWIADAISRDRLGELERAVEEVVLRTADPKA